MNNQQPTKEELIARLAAAYGRLTAALDDMKLEDLAWQVEELEGCAEVAWEIIAEQKSDDIYLAVLAQGKANSTAA